MFAFTPFNVGQKYILNEKRTGYQNISTACSQGKISYVQQKKVRVSSLGCLGITGTLASPRRRCLCGRQKCGCFGGRRGGCPFLTLGHGSGHRLPLPLFPLRLGLDRFFNQFVDGLFFFQPISVRVAPFLRASRLVGSCSRSHHRSHHWLIARLVRIDGQLARWLFVVGWCQWTGGFFPL